MNEAEEIVRIDGHGHGVTISGRRAPLAVPGDGLGEDGAVVPGPHHQTPPCRHFPECGGCQLQHLDDDGYRSFLVDRIAGALAAQGLTAPEMRVPRLSPPVSRRRAALSARRAGGKVLLGFKAEASDRIIDMHECFVLRTELFALVAPLRALIGRLTLDSRGGSVRMTIADQGVDLLLETIAGEGLQASEALTRFADTYRLARLAIDCGDGPEPRWEPEPVTVSLGGVPVAFPSGAFLQATAEGEAALVAAVREAVAPAQRIADLFAGLGTFSLALSGRIAAVEGDRAAALALKSAANRTQRPILVQQRDLFRNPLQTDELKAFEAVVLDPPRAGAREQVLHLAGSGVVRIAFVSCNPATFARDARLLIDGGYRLLWIQPVGQFRWSTHVELVGAFAR